MSRHLAKLKSLTGTSTQIIQSYLRLGAAEAPKYIDKVKDDIIYKKASDLNSFYTKILGLDEVKVHQDRVVMLQEKLLGVQEQRRDIGKQLTEIRKKSSDLQDQIHKVKRNDDLQRFLDLMREETEILKTERDVNANFLVLDREEREIFTAFTNAVRDSHEKQRAQLEYTKYFGLILSIVGSFLTFCYSSLRKRDLKKFIEENLALHYEETKPLLEQFLYINEKHVDRVKNIINVETSPILEGIDNNYKTIIQLLNESSREELKHRNSEILKVLQNQDNVSSVSHVNVPNQQDVLLFGSITVVGLFILFKLFS